MKFTKKDNQYLSLVKEITWELKQSLKNVLEKHNPKSYDDEQTHIKAALTATTDFVCGLAGACDIEPEKMVAAIEACMQMEHPEFKPLHTQVLNKALEDACKERGQEMFSEADKPDAPTWIKDAAKAIRAKVAAEESLLDAEPSESATAQADQLMADMFKRGQD